MGNYISGSFVGPATQLPPPREAFRVPPGRVLIQIHYTDSAFWEAFSISKYRYQEILIQVCIMRDRGEVSNFMIFDDENETNM